MIGELHGGDPARAAADGMVRFLAQADDTRPVAVAAHFDADGLSAAAIIVRALHRAVDLGVNFVDTADVYGDGHSERLIARLRRERGEELIVATKAGRRLSPHVAAGFTLATMTAWRMMVSRARVRAGEQVLIWGIGGGVALAAAAVLVLSPVASAAVIASFSPGSGQLNVFGDSLNNSIVISRDAAGKILVNGGAIALGHPLGASGAKLMATLIHSLRRHGKRFGLQTMCEGGGIANVTVVEALN